MKDRWVQNKLRPLFVNKNTDRGKHVALQNNWSPAVGSSVCIKGKLCSALPPQPSAPGRMSTFSLDPWRELNTKLNRENRDAEVGCYSAKPPSPMSHSTDTVASPSAIPRTEGRMPLPDSAANTGVAGPDSRCILWMGPLGITVQTVLSSTVVCCSEIKMFYSLFSQRGSELCMMSCFSSPQSTCMGALRLWLAGAPSNSRTEAASTGLYSHTLLLY